MEKGFQLGNYSIWQQTSTLGKKSGAWYAYNDEKIGQGRENAKAYLADHPEVVADLNQKVQPIYGIGVSLPVEVEEEGQTSLLD